jgi:CBS domain-containing protein
MTTVTLDVTLAALRRVFTEHRLRTALVVDPDGKLQGIVSRSDLTVAPIEGTVGDIMPQKVHALPESAPLGFAVALMALDDISEVPLVTDDGVPTGICHSLDVVRWLAGRLGYVVHGEEAHSR